MTANLKGLNNSGTLRGGILPSRESDRAQQRKERCLEKILKFLGDDEKIGERFSTAAIDVSILYSSKNNNNNNNIAKKYGLSLLSTVYVLDRNDL